MLGFVISYKQPGSLSNLFYAKTKHSFSTSFRSKPTINVYLWFFHFFFPFLSQCHQWKTRPKFPNRRKIRPLLFHFCSVFLFTSPPLYRNNRYIESNIRSFALPSCHWYHHHLKVVPTHFGFSHLHYYSPPHNLPLSSGSLTAMLGNFL